MPALPCVRIRPMHPAASKSPALMGLVPVSWALVQNTGVGCYSLLQGIFLTQGLNLGLFILFMGFSRQEY